MSISYIPEHVKYRLWGLAGGRCQYRGCNRSLWLDDVTKAQFNSAYVAHIVADKVDGPRGHPVLSNALRAEISNLMLLCDPHHLCLAKILSASSGFPPLVAVVQAADTGK